MDIFLATAYESTGGGNQS